MSTVCVRATVRPVRPLTCQLAAPEAFLAQQPKLTFVINGLSWPATERLVYRRGEQVRWRVVNVSSQAHPIHLHGFYFTVTHLGDGTGDATVDGGIGRREVTHVLPPVGTMSIECVPEREGNWLFHCHVMHHVSPARQLGTDAAHHTDHSSSHHDAGPSTAPSLGMAGMVLGITVKAADGRAKEAPHSVPAARRRLTVVISRATSNQADWGFSIRDAGVNKRDTVLNGARTPLGVACGHASPNQTHQHRSGRHLRRVAPG